MLPQSHFEPSLTKISSSATSIPFVAKVILRDRVPQQFVTLLGSVAAKRFTRAHFIDGAVHRCDHGLRQRLGDIADPAANDALRGLGIRLPKSLHPPGDLGKEITGLELEIVFIQQNHKSVSV